MIYTGIDIVSNRRIEKAVERFRDRFFQRVYTENEINYCKSRKEFISCISARFACKEAVLKAYYQAFSEVLPFRNIEILGEFGKPATVNIIGDKHKGEYWINISISHERDYSVAVAVIQKIKVKE
jgi:holo-[acyl-carrier protein] synthase